MRVLVVEDQEKTSSFIRKGMKSEGITAEVVQDGESALATLATTAFDAVVLDVMLPGIDGLAVLRRLRESGNRVPVILLTARSGLNEKVEGLDAGADDYLPKPFAMEELFARVRALGRRSSGEMKPTVLRVGNLELDTLAREARRGDRTISLSTREYFLLEHLMRSVGRVCARMSIVEKVWAYDFDPGTNLVDVYVMRVRDKIEQPGEEKLLHTVRGFGYIMKEPVR